MDEFDFIRTHLASIAGQGAEDLRDDCAWLGGEGNWLVLSTDTSVEGVHFPKGHRGASASERAVRIALSDIAAKAADPVGMLVNLSLPHDMSAQWLGGLALGLKESVEVFGCPLLGGDTVRYDGPLAIAVTILGRTPRKIVRSGAREGEYLYVDGAIGDAYLGLRYMRGNPAYADPSGLDLHIWEEAYLRPSPGFEARDMLRACATASIDVSDGMLADAEHIAAASAVGLRIEAWEVPLSRQSERYVSKDMAKLVELLSAGDDYRVLFTSAEPALSGATRIGVVVEGVGVTLCDVEGRSVPFQRGGWEH